MKYCQDGLQVDIAPVIQQLFQPINAINGQYELQPYDVNGRPYFKMGEYGFWWDDINAWWIGHDNEKGQPFGIAYYTKDAFCPHQLSELEWAFVVGSEWFYAGNYLVVTCKWIFIQTKSVKISYYMISFSWHFR